ILLVYDVHPIVTCYISTMRAASNTDSTDLDEPVESSNTGPIDLDPFDYVYSNIPDSTHILKHAENCEHCKAKKFQYETDGFCCRNGEIELAEPEPLPELMRLWSSADADSRHFRESIRFFNGHFAFTTLGVSLDNNYTNMKSGVYTFRAHGTMYHRVHSFGPRSRPEHLQLYFYDDDPSLSHRKEATKQLDQHVVSKLVDVLRENPYSQQFRSLGAHKENLEEYRIDLNIDQKLDQRRYNRPVSSEVAAIWVEGSDLANRFNRNGCYDPLSYPLFFPRGELGWHPNIPKHNVPWEVAQQPRGNRDNDSEGNSRLCVSVRDYYCYRLKTRPAIFNPILHGARLFQQWGVDMFIKIEGCRLKWIRDHQREIRADLYQGLVDSIAVGEMRASAVGKRIVLPGTHQGSNGDMKRRQMDAMALVQTYGKPDIFLTMTCNPSWEEILNELLPGQTPQDRPDLVARVFRAKLETMKEMLFKKHILGVVVAHAYVVEF
uniref:Helitron helicase-like domain-containing protein n=1 Tax=Aegilops tauschii subsp. strangulata TaxID=200361 RepID=A0A452YMX3_AEGTS